MSNGTVWGRHQSRLLLYLSSGVSGPRLVKACVLWVLEWIQDQASFGGWSSPSCAVGDVCKGLIPPKGRVSLAGSERGIQSSLLTKNHQSLQPQGVGTCALASDTSDITLPFLGCRAAQNSLLRALVPKQLWPGAVDAVGAVLVSWWCWGCGSIRRALLLGSPAALVRSSWLCWHEVGVSLGRCSCARTDTGNLRAKWFVLVPPSSCVGSYVRILPKRWPRWSCPSWHESCFPWLSSISVRCLD